MLKMKFLHLFTHTVHTDPFQTHINGKWKGRRLWEEDYMIDWAHSDDFQHNLKESELRFIDDPILLEYKILMIQFSFMITWFLKKQD